MRTPGKQRSRARRRASAALLLAAGAALAAAAPYVPAGDTTVLERVPARAALERLAPLREMLAVHPDALDTALALAQAYIAIGRENGDPRFVAYGEATLASWMRQSRPPEKVLVVQATALQYLHRFDESLGLLERALALQPLDAQAWLTRATLLELRGDYAGARPACARLARAVDALIAITCLASVDGRSGRLAESYERLRALPADDARLPADTRAWALAVRAEMAERLGDDASAAFDYAAALETSPQDPYLRAAYADLLLRTGRPDEVLTLLAGDDAQDPLLLRLAIAAHRLGGHEAPRWTAEFAARLRVAERERDSTHQRERAMFLLDVRGDAGAALESARRNWALQREPADLRIYARAALSAHSDADCMLLARWLAATHYEDRTLPRMLECTAPPESP
jgi:tetratricopeptide (TPR) repeat protein